jgi:hypothetical protein
MEILCSRYKIATNVFVAWSLQLAADHGAKVTTTVNRHLALSGGLKRSLQFEMRRGPKNWRPRNIATREQIETAVAHLACLGSSGYTHFVPRTVWKCLEEAIEARR